MQVCFAEPASWTLSCDATCASSASPTSRRPEKRRPPTPERKAEQDRAEGGFEGHMIHHRSVKFWQSRWAVLLFCDNQF